MKIPVTMPVSTFEFLASLDCTNDITVITASQDLQTCDFIYKKIHLVNTHMDVIMCHL